MAGRLITCAGAGAWTTLDLFETSLPPLEKATQPERFEF
jgi:hypothetical protein